MIHVSFQLPDGTARTAGMPVGATLLDAARAAEVDLEGTCGGNMACATCHIRIDQPWQSLIPAPSPEEEDMLDLAPDWHPTSRLGCQVHLEQRLDGMVVAVPASSLGGG